MKIVVAGGSGFLGEPLVARFRERGDQVDVLSRSASKGLEWHPPAQGAWSAQVAAADVVVNLAGENIGDGRWTAERKKRLIASRLDATRALVAAMQSQPSKQRTFVSASATGWYGDRGDETLDESAARGTGFLSDLTQEWESAARAAEPVARVVIPRFGVVLEKSGGALAKMLPPFRLGAGGPLGSGRQWMPWVDREDALRFVLWAIDTPAARGVYNVSAPEPVRNRDFTKELGRALHRPAVLPAPAFALRLAFGEMADEALLGGQRVVPARAMAEGFAFRYPRLGEALAHIL